MPLVLARPDEPRAAAATAIEIGLLNNLSDAGLDGGERQIVHLLAEVAGSRTVRLRLFSLPAIRRGAATTARMAGRYGDVSALLATRLDGLIVTGCEPRAARLPDEAFWPQLTEVIDWAEHNTRSTIWSCFAAHAAVLHLDGIERRRLPEKRSGLYRVEAISAHPLLAGAPADLRVPHSRWNGLDAGELAAAGYQIVTRGPIVGVDTFAKSWRSQFVYLQGHPEYDGDALRREYRRDVLRYLDGTSEDYPNVPVDYFDPSTEAALLAFARRAQAQRDPALAAALPLGRSAARHGRFAAVLFRNWLGLLRAKASHHAA